MNRFIPCRNEKCRHTRHTCKYAHSLLEWEVPKVLRCDFGMDCYKSECRRLHNGTIDEKIIVAEYNTIIFREDYRVYLPKKPVVQKPLAQKPVVQKPIVPVPVVPAPVVPAPVVPEFDDLFPFFVPSEDEQKKSLLRMKIQIQKEHDELLLKMKNYKEMAMQYWEIGSTEIEFKRYDN